MLYSLYQWKFLPARDMVFRAGRTGGCGLYTDEMVQALNRLKKGLTRLSSKGGVKVASEVFDVRKDLDDFLAALDELLRKSADEAEAEEDVEEGARSSFDLCLRRLMGLAEEIRPLARKRPDSRCNVYKLRKVNDVLLKMREELEICFGGPLDLAEEEASLTYSDVSFLLRNYLDLGVAYGRWHYGLRYDENGK